MSSEKRRITLSMEKVPMGAKVGENQNSQTVSYDRADLNKTPLAKLVGLSGIIIGQKNLLGGFTEQMKYDLRELDEKFKHAKNRYTRLTNIAGENNLGKAGRLRDEVKEELGEIKEAITILLAEKFKVVFEFLIDNLEDEKLEKLEMGISQKKIAAILYDHLDYYEDNYALGKGATVLVMDFANYKAEEKGERTLQNIQRDEKDIRSLQTETQQVADDLRGTLAGIGELERIPAARATLPPREIVLNGEIGQALAAIPPAPRAEAAPFKPKAPPVKLERYISGKTEPFMPNAVVPGSYEDLVRKEAESTVSGLDFRPSKVPTISSLGLENLADVDANDTEITKINPVVEQLVEAKISTISSLPTFENSDQEVPSSKPLSLPDQTEILIREIYTTAPKTEIIYKESRTTPIPPAPVSWWERTKENVSGFVNETKKSVSKLFTETRKTISGWFKSAKDFALPKLRKVAKPLALVAGIAALGGIGVNAYKNNVVEQKNTATESAKSNVASATATSVKSAPVESTKAPVVKMPEVKTPEIASKDVAVKLPEVLLRSNNPLAQRIVKDGNIILGTHSITDEMISSMRGLTNDEQKLQVIELEKQINLGLGVYFNEHFGTPAKVAESMKDPGLRNLYRTVKHAQSKGWFSAQHTKEKYPEAYQLALKLMADSYELGHDASDNPNPNVKAFVKGNIFQAKLPGSTINLRKANGQYHIVAALMMGIIDGKGLKEMMNAGLTDTTIKKVDSGSNTPKLEVKDNAQPGTILPNIISQQHFMGDFDSTSDVDGGWDALIERADKMTADKSVFESKGEVEFDLPLSMTTREENEAVLPTLIEKVIALNPQADAVGITKLMKRFGFIGVKSWARTRPGHFKIVLHPNFLRILKPELKKAKNKVS